jgi:NAD(P)-dependent dehydrogenase (short-subunit alcohol dehydrogenase family)
MSELTGKTAIVTGGSRGFGRGVVEALAAEGMQVTAVARGKEQLAAMKADMKGEVDTVTADVTDAIVAARIIERVRPFVLVLNAGANGISRPTRFHTWETFAKHIEVDVKGTFTWAREALLLPLDKGSTIFVESSGAALAASPVLGGYAAAKAALWAFARCLAEEGRALGLRVHCLFPSLTPETELGREGIRDFARFLGLSEAAIIEKRGLSPPLTPAILGRAVVSILTDPKAAGEVGFRITATQVAPLPQTPGSG